jgi:hypothetical protein
MGWGGRYPFFGVGYCHNKGEMEVKQKETKVMNEITREQVEGWVTEQREKHGLYVFSVNSTSYNSVSYTIHKTEYECDCCSEPWEDAKKFLKEPWQIPPKGYRLVTESERREFSYPASGHLVKWYSKKYDNKWCNSDNAMCWTNEDKGNFAVPLGTTFAKPAPKKMTVAEVSEMAGEDVIIVEG